MLGAPNSGKSSFIKFLMGVDTQSAMGDNKSKDQSLIQEASKTVSRKVSKSHVGTGIGSSSNQIEEIEGIFIIVLMSKSCGEF